MHSFNFNQLLHVGVCSIRVSDLLVHMGAFALMVCLVYESALYCVNLFYVGTKKEQKGC